MPRHYRIEFLGASDPAVVHRVRNFGEDLVRLGREGRELECALDCVDRARDTIPFTVKSAAKARRVVAQVRTLLVEHGFGDATILKAAGAANSEGLTTE